VRLANSIDHHPTVAALLVAAASLASSARGLVQRSVWLDEAWTVALGMQKPAVILVAATHDQNPPLYNLLMAGWLEFFGTSEAALRIPSLLATAACAALFFVFVRRFYGAEAALYATLLFLVAGAPRYYATEGRAYALVELLCVTSFFLYLSNLERADARRALLLSVVNATAMYVHYTIALAFVAQAACALTFARTNRRAFRLYVASQLLALLVFAPFVPALLANAPVVETSWLPIPDLAALYGVCRDLAGSKSALYSGLLLAAVASIRRVVAWRRARPAAMTANDRMVVVAAAWASLPIVLAFFISQWSPILYLRYELFAALGWIALIAALLAALPWPPRARFAVASFFVFLAAKQNPSVPSRDPEWRSAAAIARASAGDSHQIIIAPAVECIPFAYYARREVLRSLFRPDGSYDFPGFVQNLASSDVLCLDESSPLPEALPSRERLVLILSNPAQAAAERIRVKLAAHADAVGQPASIAGRTIQEWRTRVLPSPAERRTS
jgi:mannosyltransferase